MSVEVLLPQLGFAMTEGNLVEWLVADGAAVKEGDPIFALESEKSTQEVEAPASGTIRLTAAAGQIYAVGTLLGTIE